MKILEYIFHKKRFIVLSKNTWSLFNNAIVMMIDFNSFTMQTQQINKNLQGYKQISNFT